MFSSRIKNLFPYKPGEQPRNKNFIKLNANENPYPPCDAVLDEMKIALENPFGLSLYPDPESLELKTQIAKMLNQTGGSLCNPEFVKTWPCDFKVTPKMIYCGNGSDEVLSFAFYAFFDSNSPIVMTDPTYSFYPVYAGFYDIPILKIPLDKNFQTQKKLILDLAKKNNSCLIISNPAATAGTALSIKEIREMLLDFPCEKIFVVDEAYADFFGESCIPLLHEFKNLVVIKTFSKSFCGAGMRLGFAVASEEICSVLTTVKNSVNHFPLDFLTQKFGCAVCKNFLYFVDTSKKICDERKSFSNFLREHDWIFPESFANFILAKKNGIAGSAVYEKLKAQGILARHFNDPKINDYVRITIGTKDQMQKVCDALCEF